MFCSCSCVCDRLFACQCFVLRFVFARTAVSFHMWSLLGLSSDLCELINSVTLLICALSLLAWSLHARAPRATIMQHNVGVQTHAVVSMTSPDLSSIFVTEFGERFHCSVHCKGWDARNTRYRLKKYTPCSLCVPMSPRDI